MRSVFICEMCLRYEKLLVLEEQNDDNLSTDGSLKGIKNPVIRTTRNRKFSYISIENEV